MSPELAQYLIVAWLVVLGAAVGSFLNVLVYRLPAGMNIAWPGSHCPSCRHPIRWFDNIPVLGWLVLRGRCRDCRAPISPRYPLVEAATTALFAALAVQEILRGGAILSLRASGAIDAGLSPSRAFVELLALCGLHLLLLTTLFAAALLAYDGKRPPQAIFFPAVAVGLLALIGWPELHPVPVWPGLAEHPFAGLLDGAAGLLAGGILGGGMVLLGRLSHAFTGGVLGGAVCVGVVMGWQIACVVSMVAIVADFLFRLAGRRRAALVRVPAVGWLGAAALAWMLAWPDVVAWVGRR